MKSSYSEKFREIIAVQLFQDPDFKKMGDLTAGKLIPDSHTRSIMLDEFELPDKHQEATIFKVLKKDDGSGVQIFVGEKTGLVELKAVVAILEKIIEEVESE